MYSMIVRESPTEDFIANPNLINKQAARIAYAGTSFDPEKRGEQAIQGFADEVNSMYERLKPYAKSEAQKATLISEMERFQASYAQKYNDLLYSHSRLYSTMIAGPSKFPVERMRKLNEAYDKKADETREWKDRAERAILRILKGEAIEEAGGEIEVLKKKIADAERNHEFMVKTNVIVRKKIPDDQKIREIMVLGPISESTAREILKPDFMGRIGFPAYSLSNDLANIARMKERVKELEKKETTPTGEIPFTGGKIIDNREADRIQIIFDQKPQQEMINRLRSEGWRWSPSNAAWQRKRTDNALYSARRILGLELKGPVFVQVKGQPSNDIISLARLRAAEWFKAQVHNPYEQYYLYHRIGDFVISNTEVPGYTLSDAQRISTVWTVEQATSWIIQKAQKLPILPLDAFPAAAPAVQPQAAPPAPLANPAKYKLGQMIYSYQNPTIAAPIIAIHISDDPQYAHTYILRIPSSTGEGTKNSNNINEESLSETPISSAPITEAPKQPWEMSYREFADFFEDVYGGMKHSFAERVGKPLGIPSQAGEPYKLIRAGRLGYEGALQRDRWRRAIVEKAIEQGKTVPQEVLTDFPDIMTEKEGRSINYRLQMDTLKKIGLNIQMNYKLPNVYLGGSQSPKSQHFPKKDSDIDLESYLDNFSDYADYVNSKPELSKLYTECRSAHACIATPIINGHKIHLRTTPTGGEEVLRVLRKKTRIKEDQILLAGEEKYMFEIPMEAQPNQRYRYYFSHRPPSIGTQPEGFINHEEWLPAKLTPLGNRAFGWVEYSRPLTPDELYRFELFEDVIVMPKLVQDLVKFAHDENVDEAMKAVAPGGRYYKAMSDWMKANKTWHMDVDPLSNIRNELIKLGGKITKEETPEKQRVIVPPPKAPLPIPAAPAVKAGKPPEELQRDIVFRIQDAKTIDELQETQGEVPFLPLSPDEKNKINQQLQRRKVAIQGELPFGVRVAPKPQLKPVVLGAPTPQQQFEAERRQRAEREKKARGQKTLPLTSRRLFEFGVKESMIRGAYSAY